MKNQGMLCTVQYEGTLDDGTVFDTTRKTGNPVVFECMAGKMISGFDRAVARMSVGETINITLPYTEAFGKHAEEMVVHYPKDKIPNADQYAVGDRVTLRRGRGIVSAAVIEANNEELVLDCNHPLAGKTVHFEITLEKVEEPKRKGDRI